MRRITDYLLGTVSAEVVGADTAGFLNNCARLGIRLRRARPVDACTLNVVANNGSGKSLLQAAKASGCELIAVRGRGVPSKLRSLRRRWVLAGGMALTALSLLFSSMYVWDIDVVGNERVSSAEVFTALNEAGVSIGSFWPSFSIDTIRSRVLLDVKGLCWLSVNVRGSRATVVVRESVEKPELAEEAVPGDVVAEKSGIISDMSVLRGYPLVKRGDTVSAGEILVSGVVPSSYAPTRAERAMADITARTWYELTAVYTPEIRQKSYTGRERTRFAVVLGGLRINIFGSSRNPYEYCDKIYDERKLSLRDIFTLPIGIVKTTLREYVPQSAEADVSLRNSETEVLLMTELESRMSVGGEIVSSDFVCSERGGAVYITLRAECIESIGVETELTPERLAQLETENLTRTEQ